MITQDKYTKIMEVMSDKTLSQWCVIWSYEVYPEECEEYWTYRIISYVEYKIWNGEMNSTPTIFSKIMSSVSLNCEQRLSDFEKHCLNWRNKIIWHPLRIWDVLDWIEKKWDNMEMKSRNLFQAATEYNRLCVLEKNEINQLHELWKDKRLPLSPTDEELIDYIYNLLP